MLGLGSQILGGRLTDIVRPKKIMLSGYTMSFLTVTIIGYLILINVEVLVLFVLYHIFTPFRGISQPSKASITADHDPRAVKSGYILLTIGGNLGFATGPSSFELLAFGPENCMVLGRSSSAHHFSCVCYSQSEAPEGLRAARLRFRNQLVKEYVVYPHQPKLSVRSFEGANLKHIMSLDARVLDAKKR